MLWSKFRRHHPAYPCCVMAIDQPFWTPPGMAPASRPMVSTVEALLWLWGLNEMITLDSRWFVSCMCRTSRTDKMFSIFSMQYISVCLRMYTVVNYFWHARCRRREIQTNAPTMSKQKRQTNVSTLSSKGLRQPACVTQQEWGFCVILPLYTHGKTTVCEFSVKGAWPPGVHAQKPSPRWNNVKQGCLTSLDLSHSCCNL